MNDCLLRAPPERMPTTGTTISHYEVRARLGSGGMGEVYRARDTRLGREVALKFIDRQHRQDPERRARLLKEARAASLLRSPAVATTYDIGEDGEDLFIVMELVDGQPLSEHVRNGPLPIDSVLKLAGPVADALDEAHSLGIIHRDIKSANIMLSDRRRVKVLDFGLAKITGLDEAEAAAQETMAETKLGTVVGTVAYLSPEQALGLPVDARSDLFSLGVVLYEALAGRLPFAGDTVTAVIDQILHHEPPALGRLNYEVPSRLDQMVRKLLAKAPSDRYQTARDLLVDVRSLRRELELESQTGSSSRIAAAKADAPPSLTNAVAVLPFANITREPADDWIGSGIAETVMADAKAIHGLTVIGRERVFDTLRHLGSSAAGQLDERVFIDVGRQLRATWLVAGGYQRLGEHIRITARVVDVASGTVFRTVKIDGAISEIFELQDKIIYELSRGLNVTLDDSQVAAIERKETKSVAAYEDRSRAMMNLMEGSPQAIDRAIHMLERATLRDPDYAAAWAALGTAYDLKGSFLSLPDLSKKAIEMERKAIAIDPKLTDAHRWLGRLSLMSIARYDEAIAAIKEAEVLDPDDAAVHSSLGRAYWVGKGQLDDGIRHLEHAARLNPEMGYAHLQLGLLYALRGDYAQAEAACLQAIDQQERFASGREGLQIVGAHTRLGYVYYLQGRYDEALQVYNTQIEGLAASDHALKERSLIDLDYKIGATHLRLGHAEEAERHFASAVKAFDRRVARGADDPFTRYYMATLWALRGDVDRATRYLEDSCRHLPALNRARARVDPDFDPIRADHRFVALLESIGEPSA